MRQWKRLPHDFVLILSQPESMGSSKFLCLPPIIRRVLWGADTRILKIRCFLAQIEATQNHARDVFSVSPFIYLKIICQFSLFIYEQGIIFSMIYKKKSLKDNLVFEALKHRIGCQLSSFTLHIYVWINIMWLYICYKYHILLLILNSMKFAL